jgi:hypothetical protein
MIKNVKKIIKFSSFKIETNYSFIKFVPLMSYIFDTENKIVKTELPNELCEFSFIFALADDGPLS